MEYEKRKDMSLKNLTVASNRETGLTGVSPCEVSRWSAFLCNV